MREGWRLLAVVEERLSVRTVHARGPADDEDDDEQVPRSPFVLTGLPPEVNFL